MLRAWSEVWQSGETEIVEREKSAGNAGEGGNSSGHSRSASAGVLYYDGWAASDCVRCAGVREEGIPPNLAESPITPLPQAQQADRVNIDKIRVHTLIRR